MKALGKARESLKAGVSLLCAAVLCLALANPAAFAETPAFDAVDDVPVVSEEAPEPEPSGETPAAGAELLPTDEIEPAQPVAGAELPPIDEEDPAQPVAGAELPSVDEVVPIQSEHVAGTVLVQVKPGFTVEDMEGYLEQLDYVTTETVTQESIEHGFVALDLADGVTVEQAVAALDEADFCDGAQPDYVYYLLDDEMPEAREVTEVGGAAVPRGEARGLAAQATAIDDPYAQDENRSWQLDAVNAYEAWDIVKGDHKVTVAVLDSGCLVDHEDIAANIVATYNAVVGASNRANNTDLATGDVTDIRDDGHGTHVAGIIAAAANNGVGIAGVSYNANIMPICVMYKRDDGKIVATSKDTIEALTFIVETKDLYNIRVANISLGKVVKDDSLTSENDRLLADKVQQAIDAGILVTMAAGNSDLGATPYQCFPIDFCPSALGVINATRSGDTFAKYSSSNYNTAGQMSKEISAPGTDIWSLAKTGTQDYRSSTGTSMAAPCVAGIAALLFAENPALTPAQVKSILCSTALDLGDEGFDEATGYGLVNAYAAVREITSYLDGPDYVMVGDAVAFAPSVHEPGQWTWSSGNEGIATVDAAGVVSGIAGGSTSITATYHEPAAGGSDIVLVKTITVYDPAIEGATSIEVDATATLEVVNAMPATWTWSSSDDAIATVGAGSGVVSGKAPGQVVITATLVGDSSISVSATLTVTEKKQDPVDPVDPEDPETPVVATWKRLFGDTALDTMVAVVKAGKFPTGGTVLVASAEGYWDALSASGLAGLVQAPVLMTATDKLSSQTEALLRELSPTRVVICGGTSSVSDATMSQVKGVVGSTAKVERIFGDNASGTANALFVAAGKFAGASWQSIGLVATAQTYQDALSASALAYGLHLPIFLADDAAHISTATLSAMKAGGVTQVYLVGGTDSLGGEVERALAGAGIFVKQRLQGETSVETSVVVAKKGLELGLSAGCVGVATAMDYYDALSGVSLAGKLGAPIVLVVDEKSASIGGFVRTLDGTLANGYVFGGTDSVSTKTYRALAGA